MTSDTNMNFSIVNNNVDRLPLPGLNSMSGGGSYQKKNQVRNLEPHHEQLLFDESGLRPEVLFEGGIWSASQIDAERMFGLSCTGIVFPYIDLDGREIGSRMKLDEPLEDMRYVSQSGIDLSCYFLASGITAILDPTQTLVAIEGEKKLLAIRQDLSSDFAAFASFPGAHNWKSKGRDELTQTWRRIVSGRRKIILIPDSDFFSNSHVASGIEGFIRQSCEAGAKVELVDLRGVK